VSKIDIANHPERPTWGSDHTNANTLQDSKLRRFAGVGSLPLSGDTLLFLEIGNLYHEDQSGPNHGNEEKRKEIQKPAT